MTEARRHDSIALAILALVATLLFVDVLAGTHNFYMRDLTRYYYPTKQVLRDIVQGGEFPWWNRHFAAGQPIAANPEHEVFYPFTWLILLPELLPRLPAAHPGSRLHRPDRHVRAAALDGPARAARRSFGAPSSASAASISPTSTSCRSSSAQRGSR